MGRRSNFARIEKDNYPTIDRRATPPLLRHLPAGAKAAEPCAGAGHLVDRLLEGGVDVAWASTIEWSARGDIRTGVDVLTVEPEDADVFITNPPWKRPLLHKIIVHLSDQRPTWLLFDSAWAFTKQATRFMSRCRKIVAVGRLIWIEGTTMQGKDDVSWYLFDKPLPGSGPAFFGRDCAPPAPNEKAHRICADCRLVIDRFGKWHLATRNGVSAPVHDDCRHPNGPPRIVETPLLDWSPDQ